MPHTHTSGRRSAAAVLLILLLACIGLAACGSSSSGTSSNAAATSTSSSASSSAPSTGTSSSASTGTSSTGSTATTPPAGARGPARFAAMRECLRKNGITLPARPGGAGAPRGGGAFLGGGTGPNLPKGVSRTQYEAALKKCGGGRFGGAGAGFHRVNNPAFKQGLTKFAECLRQNGVNVPAPNTSGNGPIFNTKGINTASSKFVTAAEKCRKTLIGTFRRPPGAGAPTGAGGAPPAAGQAQGGESSG